MHSTFKNIMDHKTTRYDFTSEAKKHIARRAGYRCSFPGCNKLLVGPDTDSTKSIEFGECAHIYAASEDGR